MVARQTVKIYIHRFQLVGERKSGKTLSIWNHIYWKTLWNMLTPSQGKSTYRVLTCTQMQKHRYFTFGLVYTCTNPNIVCVCMVSLCVFMMLFKSRDQNVISQQMQWTTSLVTPTPTSGPLFVDEAELNNYPSLNTQTTKYLHMHTTPPLPQSYCKLNRKTV